MLYTSPEINIISNFAFEMVASTLTWSEFIQQQEVLQKNQEQTMISTPHNNVTSHGDSAKGTASPIYYDNHTNTINHTNTLIKVIHEPRHIPYDGTASAVYKHDNVPGKNSHNQGYSQNSHTNVAGTTSHTNKPYANVPHSNTNHANIPGTNSHTNKPHTNKGYSQTTPHNNKNAYGQVTVYSQGGPPANKHTNTPHTNVAATHTNKHTNTESKDSHTNKVHTNTAHKNTAHIDNAAKNTHNNVPHSNAHNNRNEHSNHTNYPHTNNSSLDHYHVDLFSDHTNVNTHNNQGYAQTGHCNIRPAHQNRTQSHSHYQVGAKEVGVWGHNDGYTQYNQYDSKEEHANSHSNGTSHNDAITSHGNKAAHSNYVPCSPALYNIVNDQVVSGTITIGLYSYDANKAGLGSQDNHSKDVYYDMKIRKVKKIDGTSDISGWVNHLSGQISAANGSYQYNLNTVDLLKTGNTNLKSSEGHYEIQCTAYNIINGERQESNTQTITIIVYNNESANLDVLNPSEFINFTFSYNGILNNNGIYSEYGSNYAAAPSNKQNGVFIEMKLTDPSPIQQWQKAWVYIVDQSNNPVISGIPVVWENNSNITSVYDGGSVKGQGFIPNSYIEQLDEVKNHKIMIEVAEYNDAACTMIAGTKLVTTKVSSRDLRDMVINIDSHSPNRVTFAARPWEHIITSATGTYSIAAPQQTWSKDNINAAFSVLDGVNGSGIGDLYYRVSNVPSTPGSWIAYTANAPINVSANGDNYVHYKAIDKAGNVHTGYALYKIDKEAPAISVAPYIQGNQIKLQVSDLNSGIGSIVLPDGTIKNGNGADFVDITISVVEGITTYDFEISDIAGNKLNYTYVYQALSINSLTVTNVVRAPAGTVCPIIAPAASPIGVKTGYNITLDVETNGADDVTLDFSINGTPVDVRTSTGITSSTITKIISVDGTVVTRFIFWLDESIPKGSIIDVDITASTNLGGYSEVTDTTLGENLFLVVGSATGDNNENQTN